jgi:hypothetical protein
MVTKGCKGTAIYDLFGASPIDVVRIETSGAKDLVTDLYEIDAHGKETRLSKRARSVRALEESVARTSEGEESSTTTRLGIAVGEPSPSGDGTDGSSDDGAGSASSALTSEGSTDPAGQLAGQAAKAVSDLAVQGVKMPAGMGAASSGGAANGLGSITPGQNGMFPGQADLMAAVQKQATDGQSAAQQAFEDVRSQAQKSVDDVGKSIADAQAGKGLGPIGGQDQGGPGSSGSPGDSGGQPGQGQSGGPSGSGDGSSSGEPSSSGGEPASGGQGNPATGGEGNPATGGQGNPATGGEGATGGDGHPATGGHMTGGEHGVGSEVPRGTVGYRGGKGVKTAPQVVARMYDGLGSMNQKHLRLHVTFDATKAKPTVRVVESASASKVMADKSFSSSFPNSCK